MSLEHTSRAITENKDLMQLYADKKSLESDIKLHEGLRASDPTRVSEYQISQKKYELSQIERRIKGLNYASVKAQCEKYFYDNASLFDKGTVIAQTRDMIAKGQTVNEWPHLAAVFLLDVQAVTSAMVTSLATVAVVAAAPSAQAPAPAAPSAQAPAPAAPSAQAPAPAPVARSSLKTETSFPSEVTERKDLKDKKMTVIAQQINLRDQDAKVVGKLDKGQEVTLTGNVKTSGGGVEYYEAKIPDGNIVYISSKVIDSDKAKVYHTPALATPRKGDAASKPADAASKPADKASAPADKASAPADKASKPGEAAIEGKEVKNKIQSEIDAMLTSKGLTKRVSRNGSEIWKDTKDNDFKFHIDPESGNVVYSIERKSFWDSNRRESDFEQDILDNVSSILKKNRMNGGQVLNNDGGYWGVVALGLATAGAILAWRKWGRRALAPESPEVIVKGTRNTVTEKKILGKDTYHWKEKQQMWFGSDGKRLTQEQMEEQATKLAPKLTYSGNTGSSSLENAGRGSASRDTIATELRSVNNDLRAQRSQLENMRMSGATTSETEALERAILGNETKKAGLKSKAAESTANINTPLPSPDFPTKNKALEWWNSLTTVQKIGYPTGALITIGGIAYVVTPSGKVEQSK